ncbi:hypothetical protein ACHAQH_001653 [Verticillium albo-atrum]
MTDVGKFAWISGSALFAVVLAYAMGLCSWKNHMPVEGKVRDASRPTHFMNPYVDSFPQTILLTGASEGMGRSAAIKLAARGANIIAVARNAARLEALLPELKAAAKNPDTQRFTYLTADIGLPDFAEPLLASATAWNDGRAPDIVWCVAGMATPGLFAETPFSVLRRNTDVNFYGTAELAHAVLRVWLSPDAPRPREKKFLVMTSSVAAFCPIAGYSPYVPSKVALRGLADSLSQELLLYPENPVSLHVVFPGTITSPGLERENLTKPEITHQLEDLDPVQSPDQCAEAAIRGLERGDYFVTVAWLGFLMRVSLLGGSIRNSWVIDTLTMMFVTPLVWVVMLPDIMGKARKYGKTHGHPRTYSKVSS